MSTQTLRRWVVAHGKEFTSKTGKEGWCDLTAHDFRRTWATALAGNDGVDALLVCQ